MTWTTSRPSAARTDRGGPRTEAAAAAEAADATVGPRTGAARNALRAGVFVAVLASGALALTACSSSSGSSSADAKASSSVSGSAAASGSGRGGNSQAMDAYRQCLSQHGVSLPTFKRPSGGARPSGRPSGGFGGGFGGGGFGGIGGASPDAATQKALQACASKRPQFNGGGQGGANSSAFAAFTSCLKDHGVTLPTASPGASGSAGTRGGFGGFRGAFNTSDPKAAKAYATCKALLPQRPSSTPS